MTSKYTAQLLADLGITRSLGRPRVSDDNPFSEAHFTTVKYHPSFPGRFPDIHQAIDFCRSFFPWYNHDHRHGGIAMLAPADVHHGRAEEMLAQRERTLHKAWSEHPERFVHGRPKPQPLPQEVAGLNPVGSISITGYGGSNSRCLFPLIALRSGLSAGARGPSGVPPRRPAGSTAAPSGPFSSRRVGRAP